ncbi:hypothetical protein BDV95DRAFT_320800 [Massariosphaeria phaeospora]|uniref:Uncharacterized protein n=1 Tax=Massariosphaeria phaeospora TaxID=100035 RepID=A0A7C8MFH3_9PLEO|nr:hypothetical protein BDV95DRAFT_320800 [Massariosphaeria phaeospora]
MIGLWCGFDVRLSTSWWLPAMTSRLIVFYSFSGMVKREFVLPSIKVFGGPFSYVGLFASSSLRAHVYPRSFFSHANFVETFFGLCLSAMSSWFLFEIEYAFPSCRSPSMDLRQVGLLY